MEIFILGSQNAGKSSIQKVVFQKLSPHETLFLEHGKTTDSMQVANNPHIKFIVNDFPPDVTFSINNHSDVKALKACKSIIFVLDAQASPYDEACAYFAKIISVASKVNPSIYFDLFIHKMDGDLFNSDEAKIETQNEVKVLLKDCPQEPQYHLTSIYDHSIFEAMSKVVQKVLPHTPYLRSMLNALVDGHLLTDQSCKIEKAIIFDVLSKIYLATDRENLDLGRYEICSEMIDVTIDVSYVYGMEEGEIMKENGDGSAIIKLASKPEDKFMILQLNEVGQYLALVCIMGEKEFSRQHLINYNIKCFKEGLTELLKTLG